MSQQLYIRDAEFGVTIPILLNDDNEVMVEVSGGEITGEVTVEPGTKPIVTEAFNHELVHDGLAYLGGYVNETLGIGAETTLGIDVVSGCVSLHALLRNASGGDAHLWLYEAVTLSGGTPLTMNNRNRVSTNTLTHALVYENPTITVSGTAIAQAIIPGGNFAGLSMGGSMSEEIGWVLRDNTQYAVRLLNLSVGVEPISMGVLILDEA